MSRITIAPILLLAGVLAGIPLGVALSQAKPQLRVETLLERVVTGIPQPTSLRVHDDRWDPGADTTHHQHPGPVILAVIEGELVEVTAAGETILRAGQVHWRQANEMHNVKNLSAKPARVLAIHFEPAQ